MKTCFIVCPIGADDSPQRQRSDKVLKHIIEPICDELGFTVTRVDKLLSVDKIDNTIVEYLSTAHLVIADMTDHNPNAFYEIGYRHALNKPLILIKDEETPIPFDLSSVRSINYMLTDLDKVADTKERLKGTIVSFDIQEETEGSATENPTKVEKPNSMPLLLNIQDDLREIKELIKARNDKDIEQILNLTIGHIQKNTPSLTAEDRMLELLLTQAMQNPEGIEKLAEFAEKQSSKTNVPFSNLKR